MLEEKKKTILDNYKAALPFMTPHEQEILAAQSEAVAALADVRKNKEKRNENEEGEKEKEE